MIEKIRQERAVTLLALAITIIVLIILSTISIAMLGGDNGIITQANKAKRETKIAEYKEALEAIRPGLEVERLQRNLDSKKFMDRYEEEIRKNERFKDAIVTRKSDDKIQVETKEGYIYEVTEEGVEYKGKRGEEGFIIPPNLQDEDIELDIDPDTWTRQVKVGIISKISGYGIQYSFDAKTWIDYKDSIIVEENCAIFVRLVNSIGETGESATGLIENIDREEPKSFIPTVSGTSHSITIEGTAIDADKTEKSGSSGIEKYYFSNNDGETWVPDDGKAEGIYTFNNLSQETGYSLKMKAVDYAGNEKITGTITKSTEKVPGLEEGIIKIIPNPNTWTKNNVTVTIQSSISGYTIQYTKGNPLDEKTWETYDAEKKVIMTDNGTIYARLRDEIGQTGTNASADISIIDRNNPTMGEIKKNKDGWTKDDIIVTAKATDTEAGISFYQFSTDESLDENSKGWISIENIKTEMTQTKEISSNAKWYFYVKDAAENVSKSSIDITNIDKTPPGKTSVNLNGYGSGTWSNKDVTQTASASDNVGVSYYQYSHDLSTINTFANPWTINYDGQWNFYVRAVDYAGNPGEWSDVYTIKIDKTPPGKTSVNLNGYNSGLWTNKDVTQTASASDNVGVSYYQYSHDLSTINTFANPWTINWDGQWNFYVRAVDYAGNPGEWSNMYTIRRDTGNPTDLVVSYASGVNECKWQNNIKVNLSANDVSGIQNYGIDLNLDGSVDNWVNSNSFIPWNELNSCNVRFIALDGAGNYGTWSSTKHIHMDTSPPSKTTVDTDWYAKGWWTNRDVTMLATATDNVGVATYQYSQDGTYWQTFGYEYFKNPWTLITSPWTANQWGFYVRAIDHAGNIGQNADFFQVKVDKAVPDVGIRFDGYTNSSRTQANIYIACSDAHSGLQFFTRSDDPNNRITSTSYTGVFNSDITYSIIAYDNCGNYKIVDFIFTPNTYNLTITREASNWE